MENAEPMEPRLRELLGGVIALRLLLLVWSLTVTIIDVRSGSLDHRNIAFGLLALIAAWTGTLGVWAADSPGYLVRLPVLLFDVTLGGTLAAADWFVYDGPHPQSFGSAWPATAVVIMAIVAGWKAGLAAGVFVGIANLVGVAVVPGLHGRGLSVTGNFVLLATTGAIAGWVSHRLRSAESEVAAAKERERFARTLHDGVLQTLAVIQRRSGDTELVDMARDQEWELRRFIGSGQAARSDLVTELRAVAARVERQHRRRVDVVVIASPNVTGDALDALIGAANEAATNAAKHGASEHVTICIDCDTDGAGATVSVVDDGCGFDTSIATTGDGLPRSIHGRMSEVGGRALITSSPGKGTQVELWVP